MSRGRWGRRNDPDFRDLRGIGRGTNGKEGIHGRVEHRDPEASHNELFGGTWRVNCPRSRPRVGRVGTKVHREVKDSVETTLRVHS